MNTDSINSYIDKNYSEKRKIHTEGVRVTAVKLAELYGSDPEKAQIAALFHDMYRGVSENVINYYVKHLNLPGRYMNNCNLAHGKIAAIVMQRDFDINDTDIINAVCYHTTGRPGMSLLEKIIYIADAVEPNRKYPGVEELRKMAFIDIDKACLMSLRSTIRYVQDNGNYLDEDTVLAEEYFDNIIKEKEM